MAQNWIQMVLEFISSEGDSTTCLGNVFQYSVTCAIKKFFIFSWNFLCISFYPLLLALLLSTTEKDLAPTSDTLPLHAVRHWWGPLSVVSSPGWPGPAPSAFPHKRDAPVTSSTLLSSTGPAPRAPCLSCTEKPRTGLQMWPQQSWVEGQDHLPIGNSLPDAPQDTTGHMLAHRQLAVH